MVNKRNEWGIRFKNINLKLTMRVNHILNRFKYNSNVFIFFIFFLLSLLIRLCDYSNYPDAGFNWG